MGWNDEVRAMGWTKEEYEALSVKEGFQTPAWDVLLANDRLYKSLTLDERGDMGISLMEYTQPLTKPEMIRLCGGGGIAVAQTQYVELTGKSPHEYSIKRAKELAAKGGVLSTRMGEIPEIKAAYIAAGGQWIAGEAEDGLQKTKGFADIHTPTKTAAEYPIIPISMIGVCILVLWYFLFGGRRG